MSEVLKGVRLVFLDSAPVIYFIERHPLYCAILEPVFDGFESGDLVAVTSPITLAECLVLPIRQGRTTIVDAFLEVLGGGRSSVLVPIQGETARIAADIRSRHNGSLIDAFQIAAALQADCDVMLTNDKALAKVPDIRMILLDELSI
jgi:predicted nucleic acid-binding protein